MKTIFLLAFAAAQLLSITSWAQDNVLVWKPSAYRHIVYDSEINVIDIDSGRVDGLIIELNKLESKWIIFRDQDENRAYPIVGDIQEFIKLGHFISCKATFPDGSEGIIQYFSKDEFVNHETIIFWNNNKRSIYKYYVF